MKSLFAKHALLPDGWAENVRVTITAAGRIGVVETNATAQPDDSDLHERVLLPAPSNLHSHAFQRAMAGMTEYRSTGRDSFWTWRELMYRFINRLAPDQIEAIAALVYMEMLEAGYAAVGEFHYVHHQPGGRVYDRLAETSERIFAAARQSGIGLTHLPVLYTYGGASEKPLADGQLRFGNDLERFSKLVEQARDAAARTLESDARVGVAPHSLRATSPAQLQAAARRFGDGPVHIHIAEQPQEVADVCNWLGQRPVAWLLDNVDVGSRWCLVHATHMSEQETSGLARSGAVAGLCPITEANLGDGVFNGPRFLAENGVFGIGSDSNVRISLAEELRVLEYGQRLRDNARNVLLTGEGSVGETLYRQALVGGALALGRESGAIQTGLFADLVAIDGDDIAFCGLSIEQLLDGWIFAADDRVVSEVWSAGRHCVQNGRHVAAEDITARYRTVIGQLLSTL